jgi:phosphoribosyl 1,2-cyclic phosphodiesterase
LGGDGIEAVLLRSLSEPFLPNITAAMSARLVFEDVAAGDTLEPRPGVRVHTAALNHPGGAIGYRLEWNGRVVAYVTDTEHSTGELDPNVLSLIRDADLMIYDSTYTDAEYVSHKGWGHSTWEEAIRLAEAGGAARVALFHHDPSHTDDILDGLGARIALARDDVVLAREGMCYSL